MKNINTYVVEIEGAEGRYEVSNKGDIYSLRKCWIGSNKNILGDKIKLKQDSRNKYCQVWLYDGSGKKERKLVHRVVAEHFVSNPRGLGIVNHIDGDYMNNSSDNLEWVTEQRNNEHANAKYYNLISPEGIRITVYNLNYFCKENGLNQGNMSQVVSGAYLSYKGWRSADHDRVNRVFKPFKVISPQGEIHDVINCAEFSRINNLSSSKMCLVKSGSISHHKGWKLLQEFAK